MRPYIKLHADDNVVVALVDLAPGDELEVDGQLVTVKTEIKRGHKLAISNINEKQDIIKYGFAIGHATETIEVGMHVHTHNPVQLVINDF